MISLQILDTKAFMSKLLLTDTFDQFYIVEASITTFSAFHIDGHLQKDYFSSEDLEKEASQHRKYNYWSSIRPFCLNIIKGKKTPLSFKIIFQLSDRNTKKLLAQSGIPLLPEQVTGLYLNLHFDGRRLSCITGTSLIFFTLDKSLEHTWDHMIQKFFRHHEIAVSIL